MTDKELLSLIRKCVFNHKDKILLENYEIYPSYLYVNIISRDYFFTLKLFFHFNKRNHLIIRLKTKANRDKLIEIDLYNDLPFFYGLGFYYNIDNSCSIIRQESWRELGDSYILQNISSTQNILWSNTDSGNEDWPPNYFLLFHFLMSLKDIFQAYGYNILEFPREYCPSIYKESNSFLFIPIENKIKFKDILTFRLKSSIGLV